MISSLWKTQFSERLRAVQGRTANFDGCKPAKLGTLRKPRFTKGDVEKTMDGYFNKKLVRHLIQAPFAFVLIKLRQIPCLRVKAIKLPVAVPENAPERPLASFI